MKRKDVVFGCESANPSEDVKRSARNLLAELSKDISRGSVKKVKQSLRTVVRQLIKEELAATEGRGRLSDTSVDAQIDSLLVQFEDQALQVESRMSLADLLLEEEREEVSADPRQTSQDDAKEPKERPAPAKPRTPSINLAEYVRRVARLVESYDRLLDVPTVIMQRASTFLEENYDADTADQFADMLEQEYGLSLEPRDNESPRPAAAGAGPV